MVNFFIKHLQYEKRYSPHTIVSYQNDLSQFSLYLSTSYELDDPSKADHNMIRSWILVLMEEGINSRSVNRKIATLRSYYKYLFKQGLISVNPTEKIIAPKIKKALPSFIASSEMDKLLDQFEFEHTFAGLRDRVTLELLYGTGIRLSELIELKDKDVNPHSGTIKVHGKGGKERIIPMNKTLITNISIYRGAKDDHMKGNSKEHFLLTDKGDKTYPVFIYRLVKKYLSGILSDKKNPHVLRHTFATHLLNKGADLNAVKELLGHSSLAATQVYTHNSLDKIKAIFDKAHPKS
ncbi:MAG: tyrosine-type recombinase/integrase [Cytophagaceae bacterium]